MCVCTAFKCLVILSLEQVFQLPLSPGGTSSDQVVFIGQPLQLTCTAAGAPPPTYRWFKDLLPISSSSSVSVDGASGRLHIGTTDGSHAGRCTCRATNEVAGVGIIGDISTSADVYVIGTWPDGDI